MVKQRLQVFARIKPLEQYSQTITNWKNSSNRIQMQVSRNKLSNAKETYSFDFDFIFDSEVNQQQVFNDIGRSVIDNCLQGYNGTIFAYGQTGSGKTYTMSGGNNWQHRGITPRVLNYVFQQFQEKSTSFSYEMQVSFIQIYNQNGYDLLEQGITSQNTQQWHKIAFLEDQENNLQMKGVSMHGCKNQAQALDLLMSGNYVRRINETSLNQSSSRSHCIFTLYIKGRNKVTLNQVYSKLHLVDLAGSERMSKSQTDGQVLQQTKSINLSLTYLEQVIISLNQKSKNKHKSHIPYRNSLLTTLLKDSLGGNCKTVMITTISQQQKNLQETISTLRFSQRVRLIQNQLKKNQKNTFSSRIQILQYQNCLLKQKLSKYEQKDAQNIVKDEKYINTQVESFLSEKTRKLRINSKAQAYVYLGHIKQIYRKKMRDYATELTFISQKLLKYDKALCNYENGTNRMH